ncbi:MAG: SBBP repeat-containing protein [Flavobacteriales bacterium]|nr:SBBP repeat-containing protein [Flavobacteriales bacterium]
MFLRPLLALALLTSSFVAHAQVVAWAAPVGYGVSKAVAVDAQGNVYACGNANTQVDFDPGPGEALSPVGSGVNGDIYVVKYSNDGDYLWHYLVGGSGTEIAKNVAVDGNGDVLVTGYFSGYFDWDMGPDTVAPGPGTYDCFVLKLSSAGQFQWVRSIGGPGEDQDHGLAVDAANNVYVTGMTSSYVSFGEGDTTLQFGGGTWDGYYAKYSAAGSFLWAKSITGSGMQRPFSVACAGDRLYLFGSCKGSTTVNGTHTLNLPSNPMATYLCKTDTAGEVLWLKNQSAVGDMSGEVVRATDSSVYVFASFRGTVDADPGAGVLELVPPSPTYPQTLFARLDTSGNAVWARQLQGNIHFDCVGDIALDPQGGVVVTCAIAQTQDYDLGPDETILAPLQANDVFTAQYTANGDFQWVRMVNSPETFDTSNGVAVDDLGNVFMTGTFSDTAVFYPGPFEPLISDAGSTIYTVKYGVDLTTALRETPAHATLQLYPNPTRDQLTITGAFERGDALSVLDAAGREVMRLIAQEHVMQLSVRDLRPGTYTLHWTGAKGRGSARFVVMW